jgi:diadenosine tetraphosphate (Ap4A) HIT family hydrolase
LPSIPGASFLDGLGPADQAAFWRDAMLVARAVADVVAPIKMNYEIHGNTLPHLHLHLFPRQRDDPYVGGPIDPRAAEFVRSDGDIEALASAIRARTPN